MISKRTLLHALQKAQVDAIDLLFAEMSHHALCWRSIHTIPHYAELLVTVIKPKVGELDQVAKGRLAGMIEWVEINLGSATTEIAAEYKSVTRRTVIVLADIVENLIESTMGICLLHLDPTQTSIREVTTFKRQAATERLLKQAVRAWESRLFANLSARTRRIEHMIKAFFPAFVAPQNFELLDHLFTARNQFTHEMIQLNEQDSSDGVGIWSLAKVDDAFRVATDLLLSLMTAIPGDLKVPLSVSDMR